MIREIIRGHHTVDLPSIGEDDGTFWDSVILVYVVTVSDMGQC